MNVLGIFVKHPLAGRVKTRLAADSGNKYATELYAAFLADIADRFRETGDRRVLCYTPSDRAASSYFARVAGQHYELWPQPSASLGDRMAAFFDRFITAAAPRVVVIGSDSPTLPHDFVLQAFHLLESRDCVLGPATDGGFYLVGQRDQPRPIFDGVEWSKSNVLDQTVERIAGIGASLGLLSPWYDVDTLDDLHVLRGHVKALRSSSSSSPIQLNNTEPLLRWDTSGRPGSL